MLKAAVISSFASFILGSDIFERIKGVVIRTDDSTKSGDQKRKAAIKEIETIGMAIAGWAVNLGIELAVAWLKTQANKKG